MKALRILVACVSHSCCRLTSTVNIPLSLKCSSTSCCLSSTNLAMNSNNRDNPSLQTIASASTLKELASIESMREGTSVRRKKRDMLTACTRDVFQHIVGFCCYQPPQVMRIGCQTFLFKTQWRVQFTESELRKISITASDYRLTNLKMLS